MTATLHYGSFDFSTLGCQPRPTREVTWQREPSTGQVRGITHRITLEGIILPDPTASGIAAMQNSLDERKLELVALEASVAGASGDALRLEDTAGKVSWQYAGATPASAFAEYYETITGVRIASLSWPDQDATHYANFLRFRITFEAEVEGECKSGLDSVFLRETVTEQNGTPTSVAYSGWIRVCPPATCDLELDALVAQKNAEASTILDRSPAFDYPSSLSHTETKGDPTRCEFSILYTNDSGGSGTSAERLDITASIQIHGNRIDGRITARYTYRDSRFNQVKADAVRLAGVDISDYMPSGGQLQGSIAHDLQYDRTARTITGSRTIVGVWTLAPTFFAVTENVSIVRPMPAAREHVHAWLESDTAPPPCTIQIGGLRALRVSITGTIVSSQNFLDVPARVATSPGTLPVQIGDRFTATTATPDIMAGNVQTLWTTTYAQEFMHDDLGTWPGVISIATLFQAVSGGPSSLVQ